MRKRVIKVLLAGFVALLLLVVLSLFLNNNLFNYIIYPLFFINFFILFILFIKRSFKKNISIEENIYEKIVKWIVYIIPFIVIGYILWINFNPLTEAILYDIGSDKDEGILTPLERVSPTINDKGITYRIINAPLTYFNAPITPNAKYVKIQIKFKSNSLDYPIKIGAKSNNGWDYRYTTIYDKFLENKKIYNENDYPNSFEENSIIYIDPILKNNVELNIIETKLEGYTPKGVVINKQLRGSHTILLYVKDDLNFTIIKQDINMYEGIDELSIMLYKNENLIKEIIVPDDQITDSSKIKGFEQTASISEDNLEEGVYRIEILSGDDVIIKKIISNQDKLIFKDKIFILDPSEIYFKNYKSKNILFTTPHEISLQIIKVNNQEIKLEEKGKKYGTEISLGTEYNIIIPKGNVIIESENYLSLSEGSFFMPYNLFISNNIRNADYILSNYKTRKLDDGWIIAEARFKTEDLYIENNKLNFILNQEDSNLQIDWIKIELIK